MSFSAMFKASPGMMFNLRIFMLEHPFIITTAIYLASIVMFGYILRIAEKPTDRLEDGQHWDYANSFWCCVVTIPTRNKT